MGRLGFRTWWGCLVVAAIVAACGGGGGSSSPTSPSNPSQPSQPTLAACGVIGGFAPAVPDGAQSIIRGTQCSTANTPVVLLNLKDAIGQQNGQCSATIISRRAVLTAAHCVDGETASALVFQGTGDQVPSASIHRHPRYQEGGSQSFDIGVIITAGDLDHPVVPLLLSRDARVGEQAVIVGWGRDELGVGTTLRAATTVIGSVFPVYLETQVSATGSGVCSGDSGGPILLAEGEVWSIGGVTSAATTGGTCTIGSNYFGNLRHPDIRSFILGLVPDAQQR